MLSVREMAARLVVSTATVYRICHVGELTQVRIANAIQVYGVCTAGIIRPRWSMTILMSDRSMSAIHPPGLVDLLVTGQTGGDYSRWAEDALEQGLDSPSLRILAGLGSRTTYFEAEPYFRRSMAELGIALPTVDESLRRLYLREVARQISAGEISPAEGLERIHRWVLVPLGHPPDLSHWCFLWEGLDPEWYGELSERARDAMAVAAAKAVEPPQPALAATAGRLGRVKVVRLPRVAGQPVGDYLRHRERRSKSFRNSEVGRPLASRFFRALAGTWSQMRAQSRLTVSSGSRGESPRTSVRS